MIGSTSFDGTFRTWDIASQQQRLQNNPPNNTFLTKLSDNGYVAGVSGINEQQFWDVVSGKLLPKLKGQSGIVWAGALSPDGAVIATAGADNTARLWDARTGHQLSVLRGHNGIVSFVAFSPDGRTLATAGFGNARLWDVATGQELAVLDSPEIHVESVTFSPNGRMLLTAGYKTRLWDVPPRGEALAEFACARVPWPLNDDEKEAFRHRRRMVHASSCHGPPEQAGAATDPRGTCGLSRCFWLSWTRNGRGRCAGTA